MSDNAMGRYPGETGILTESVKTVFDNEWDVMPEGKKKFTFSVGVVCPFVVNIQDSPFTGIFQTGESRGMLRLSSVAPIAEGSGVRPGGGVKFFRSGKHSANFVILSQLGRMKHYNFFGVSMSNHIPEDALSAFGIVQLKLCQAQSCVTKVGLSDASTYNQDGIKVDYVVFPFKVIYLILTICCKFLNNYKTVIKFQCRLLWSCFR